MRDDVRVDVAVDSLLDDTEYKRYYKTSRGFSGKNVELFLGNFISLLARERVGAKKAFETLQQWDCWRRSEEHTSELQSLMRISYAVFCLKKKIQKQNSQT